MGRNLLPGRIVVICEAVAPRNVRSALAKGAVGLITLDQLDVLPVIIEAVQGGPICVPANRSGCLRRRPLTYREKQILALVVRGRTNAEIATTLFLAESTVKSHLSSAFHKMGASSRSEATEIILDPDSGPGLGVRLSDSALVSP